MVWATKIKTKAGGEKTLIGSRKQPSNDTQGNEKLMVVPYKHQPNQFKCKGAAEAGCTTLEQQKGENDDGTLSTYDPRHQGRPRPTEGWPGQDMRPASQEPRACKLLAAENGCCGVPTVDIIFVLHQGTASERQTSQPYLQSRK